MKPHIAIAGALLLTLPLGASELEQLRETNRQQAARIRVLEEKVRQLSKEEIPAPPAAAAAGKQHIIRPGDTLGSIAKVHGTTVAELLKANPGIKPNRLRPGQSLVLPGKAEPAPAEVAPAPAAAPTPAAAPVAAPVAAPQAPAPAAVEAAPAAAVPAVGTGETGRTGVTRVLIEEVTTAGDFAARHQTTLERLNQLNDLDLTAASVLAKGSELLCPTK